MLALCAGMATAQIYTDREGRSFYVCPEHEQQAAKKSKLAMTPIFYSWNSYPGGCVSLTSTWGLDYSLPGAIDPAKNRTEFAEAAASWGTVACIDIQPAPANWYRGSYQNIDAQFGSQTNGHLNSDGSVCQPPGQSFWGAAHAFYPSFSSVAGDVHFVEGNWDAAKGLFSCVAKHELGHSLGLPHNDTEPTSIMYPIVYQQCGFNATDLIWIRSLYAPRYPPSDPPPPPPPPPGGCEGRECRGN